MKVGMIGLGRMGANMAERLTLGGHTVTAYDRSGEAARRATERGVLVTASLEDLVGKLDSPRVLWMMVPAGEPVDKLIDSLLTFIQRDDTIIDGGNSYYRDSMARAIRLKQRNIHFVDVGTSGGIWGLKEGYSMMVGGEQSVVERLRPIFECLAPGPSNGWGHVGRNGAGHFVKMIHNGIEYGLMQAYAEGFAILKKKDEFSLDLYRVAEIWRQGSVIRSWLLDLTAQALKENPSLDEIAPFVADSGEGRWTVSEAIDLDVPAPIITLSLLERLRSRTQDSFADKLLSAMREKFGGHPIKKR